jgi:hypothetical protein
VTTRSSRPLPLSHAVQPSSLVRTMFRVVGRDAQGKSRELCISASTEEEARALARGAGLVTIDSVSIPSPARSGFAVGILGCLGALGTTILGAVIGGILGREAESPGSLQFTALGGTVLGAFIGLICGVGILAACYRHSSKRG